MMNDIINSRVDEKNWIRCGKCSHKLGRVMTSGYYPSAKLQIKCHSCKAINEWEFTAYNYNYSCDYQEN